MFISSQISLSLTLLIVLSLPAKSVPVPSQINYIAQKICKLPEPEIPEGEEIQPGKTEFYSDPEATEIFYQEIGKMLNSGDLLPIEAVNKNIMEPIQNQLVNEVYSMCNRRMQFIPFQD